MYDNMLRTFSLLILTVIWISTAHAEDRVRMAARPAAIGVYDLTTPLPAADAQTDGAEFRRLASIETAAGDEAFLPYERTPARASVSVDGDPQSIIIHTSIPLNPTLE